jgi:hypothetical protein
MVRDISVDEMLLSQGALYQKRLTDGDPERIDKEMKRMMLQDHMSLVAIGLNLSYQWFECKSEIKRKKVDRMSIFGSVQKLQVGITGAVSQMGANKADFKRPDMEEKNFPPFLIESIRGATSFNLLDLMRDIRLCFLPCVKDFFFENGFFKTVEFIDLAVATKDGRAMQSKQKRFVSAFKEQGAHLDKYDEEEIRKDKDAFRVSANLYDKAEAAKRQVLFGAPFSYHMLMEGHHSQNRETTAPITATNNDKKSLEMAFSLFAEIYKPSYKLEKDKSKVRLPIGTSPGILLKSAQDGDYYKGLVKILLSMIASKCESREDLRKQIARIGNEFEKQGYYNPSEDSFLGLRRMHMGPHKEELLFLSDNGVPMICFKSQGRIRAIFPFTEALKFWYKWLSDPLKKEMFQHPGMYTVDPKEIEKRQMKCADLARRSKFIMEYFKETGLWLPHYDLSAYDMSTGWYLNGLYNRTMRNIIPNGDKLWENGHDDAGILHLKNVPLFQGDGTTGSTIYRDDVHGRSTLSGQADVTVKNNVIHGNLLMGFLIHYYDLSRSKAKVIYNELLYKGETKIKYKGKSIPILANLHGDDVYFYGSESVEFYLELADYMTRFGIKAGFEAGAVYLKKIPQNYGSKLYNIGGSLFKNRISEFAQGNAITLCLSLIDNIEMEKYPNNSKTQKLCEERQDAEVAIASHVMGMLQIDTWPTSGVDRRSILGMKDLLSKYLAEIIQLVDPKAVRMRRAIVSETYKTGMRSDSARDIIIGVLSTDNMEYDFDDMTNIELGEVFGSYSLDSVKTDVPSSSTIVGIMETKSKDQLVDFASRIQAFLFQDRGMPPSKEQTEDLLEAC